MVISASSGIGYAAAEHWHARGWEVTGTYRTASPDVETLRAAGVSMLVADFATSPSVDGCAAALRDKGAPWDVLLVCPGTTEPIGPFAAGSFEEWEQSIQVNFVAQMRLVHRLLPARRRAAPGELEPCIILFAGGGTNGAPVNYSAYTVSKIALIKMTELLDAECPDVRVVIVGPGWVRTRIHEETLRAGERAGANLDRTVEKLGGDDWTPMGSVLDCLDWIARSPREVIGGRNISVAFDEWGTPELEAALRSDRNMYKLRRWGNDWRSTSQ